MKRMLLLLLSVFAIASCRTLPTTTETIIDTASDVGVVAGNADDTRVVLDSTIVAMSDTVSAQDDIVQSVIGIKPGEFGDAEKEALTVKVVKQAERIRILESMVYTLKALNGNAITSIMEVRTGISDIGKSVTKDTVNNIKATAFHDAVGLIFFLIALVLWGVYFAGNIFRRKV